MPPRRNGKGGAKSDKPKVPYGQFNDLDGVLDLVADADEKLTIIKDKRDQLNAEAAEIRARVRNAGVHPDAFKAGRAQAALPENKKAGFDISLQVTRRALGDPMELDLQGGAAAEDGVDLEKAKQEGAAAMLAGAKITENPHRKGTMANAAWANGFRNSMAVARQQREAEKKRTKSPDLTGPPIPAPGPTPEPIPTPAGTQPNRQLSEADRAAVDRAGALVDEIA